MEILTAQQVNSNLLLSLNGNTVLVENKKVGNYLPESRHFQVDFLKMEEILLGSHKQLVAKK